MESDRTLNIGCGNSDFGTIKLDLTRESQANVLGSASQLPFKNDSFDKVYAYNVLEHQPNPLVFLKECHRVLKHSGELFLVTDNAGYRGWFRMGKWFKDSHGTYVNPKTDKDKHYMIFTEQHLRNLFEKAEIYVIRTRLETRWKKSIYAKILTLISPTIGHAHIWVDGWKN